MAIETLKLDESAMQARAASAVKQDPHLVSKFNAPANASKQAVAKKEAASNGIVKGKIQQKKKVEQNSFQIEVSKLAFEPKVANTTAKAQVSKEAPKSEKNFTPVHVETKKLEQKTKTP